MWWVLSIGFLFMANLYMVCPQPRCSEIQLLSVCSVTLYLPCKQNVLDVCLFQISSNKYFVFKNIYFRYLAADRAAVREVWCPGSRSAVRTSTVMWASAAPRRRPASTRSCSRAVSPMETSSGLVLNTVVEKPFLTSGGFYYGWLLSSFE